MGLRVGNRIKIKSSQDIKDIEYQRRYNKNGNRHSSPGFTKSIMSKYCGREAKIIEFHGDCGHGYDCQNWVYLDIDNGRWVWDINWLDQNNIIKLSPELFEL